MSSPVGVSLPPALSSATSNVAARGSQADEHCSPPPPLKPPYSYFGGKARVAASVWAALGDVDHYTEPFFGGGAVFLARPHTPRFETINDKHGYVVNFWRAVQSAPEHVAKWSEQPSFELDLYATNKELIAGESELVRRLRADRLFYDARLAGLWVWGKTRSIGSIWAAQLTRQRPSVQRAPSASRFALDMLAARLKHVRILCGDWARCVSSPSQLFQGRGTTGVFLDPPYGLVRDDTGDASRSAVYATDADAEATDATVRAVNAWALANGRTPNLRIVVAGYADEHRNLQRAGWRVQRWKAQGGYANQSEVSRGRENVHRETLWFSPNCLSSHSRPTPRRRRLDADAGD